MEAERARNRCCLMLFVVVGLVSFGLVLGMFWFGCSGSGLFMFCYLCFFF